MVFGVLVQMQWGRAAMGGLESFLGHTVLGWAAMAVQRLPSDIISAKPESVYRPLPDYVAM